MNIILTGFMGTGKTSVGKRLAKRFGWTFVDVDQLIETSAQMSIAQLFAKRGEAVFRRLERRHISRAVRGSEQVIATGGGAFIDAENRARLRLSGPVICLSATPQAILARVGRRITTRPLLQGSKNPLARIQALLRQRARAYRQADLTLDTSALTIQEVVDRLWQQLSPCICKSWQYLRRHAHELTHRYGGKYVMVVDDRIVATGDTHLAAYQNAHRRRDSSRHVLQRLIRREAGIYYIPLLEESRTAL